VRKHLPGPDIGKDDRGTEVIPIVMGAPQSGPQVDSSVGDKEDFGIYAELRESDRSRTSLSYIGTWRCHLNYDVSQPHFPFICTAGIT